MKKISLLFISVSFLFSLSACANIPIIGGFFAGSFESQMEQLEANDWNDLFSDRGITVLYEFDDDECLVYYCPEDVEKYAMIYKGNFFSDFSIAFVIEFNNARLANEAFSSFSSSEDYDDDELYRRGNIVYVITGDYKEEFLSILGLRP